MIGGDDDDFSFSYDENDKKAVEEKKKEDAQKEKEKAENAAKRAAARVDKEGKPLPEIKVPGGNGSLPLSKNFIRVVPDNQFHRLKMDDLIVHQDWRTGLEADRTTPKACIEEGNTFRAAYGGVASMWIDYRNQRHAKITFNAPLVEQKNRSKWENISEYRQEAERFSSSLGHNTRTFHSNGKYRDMESAAKDYLKVLRRIEERTRIANSRENRNNPNYKMDVQAVVTPKDLKDMQKAAEKLNKAATTYLKYKLGPNMDGSTDGLTDYSRNRVTCAQGLLAATNKLKVIKGEEMNAAETNEREAKEELARRFGDKAEEKEYRNKQKPVQQPVLE